MILLSPLCPVKTHSTHVKDLRLRLRCVGASTPDARGAQWGPQGQFQVIVIWPWPERSAEVVDVFALPAAPT